jgi:hypothetical protein
VEEAFFFFFFSRSLSSSFLYLLCAFVFVSSPSLSLSVSWPLLAFYAIMVVAQNRKEQGADLPLSVPLPSPSPHAIFVVPQGRWGRTGFISSPGNFTPRAARPMASDVIAQPSPQIVERSPGPKNGPRSQREGSRHRERERQRGGKGEPRIAKEISLSEGMREGEKERGRERERSAPILSSLLSSSLSLHTFTHFLSRSDFDFFMNDDTSKKRRRKKGNEEREKGIERREASPLTPIVSFPHCGSHCRKSGKVTLAETAAERISTVNSVKLCIVERLKRS